MRDAAMLAALVALLWGGQARAQEASADAEGETGAPEAGGERSAAARAYDRGATAYRGGQYDRAASLFETAYRIAPNPTVLLQAVRAHERSGQPGRAATLAELLVRTFPEATGTVAEAQELLGTLAPGLLRVTLEPGEGSPAWEIDAVAQDELVTYVAPGAHVLQVTYDEGVVRERFTGRAGESVSVETAPPAEEPVAAEPEPEVTPMEEAAPAEGGGVSPWLFGTLVGATAIAGGFAIAFGVDAQANVDEYEANPTREAYEAGRDRERRTNALIGVTGGLALTALITAFFTDWGGDDDTGVSVTASGTGAGFVVRGTL